MTITPGTWTVESDGCSLTMGGQVVATAIAPDGASIGEQRANARLIAAAPKMYAFLTELYCSGPSLAILRRVSVMLREIRGYACEADAIARYRELLIAGDAGVLVPDVHGVGDGVQAAVIRETVNQFRLWED